MATRTYDATQNSILAEAHRIGQNRSAPTERSAMARQLQHLPASCQGSESRPVDAEAIAAACQTQATVIDSILQGQADTVGIDAILAYAKTYGMGLIWQSGQQAKLARMKANMAPPIVAQAAAGIATPKEQRTALAARLASERRKLAETREHYAQMAGLPVDFIERLETADSDLSLAEMLMAGVQFDIGLTLVQLHSTDLGPTHILQAKAKPESCLQTSKTALPSPLLVLQSQVIYAMQSLGIEIGYLIADLGITLNQVIADPAQGLRLNKLHIANKLVRRLGLQLAIVPAGFETDLRPQAEMPRPLEGRFEIEFLRDADASICGIGHSLEALRKTQDLSLRQAEILSQIDINTIRHLESYPRNANLEEIAQYLHVYQHRIALMPGSATPPALNQESLEFLPMATPDRIKSCLDGLALKYDSDKTAGLQMSLLGLLKRLYQAEQPLSLIGHGEAIRFDRIPKTSDTLARKLMKNLALMRGLAGLSQADVAQRLKISPEKLAFFETDQRSKHIKLGCLLTYLDAIGWELQSA